jgi:Fe-Mn family superoxide dismutase
MAYNFIKYVTIAESATPKSIAQEKLSYARGDLDPVMSEDTMNYHYGKLYKTYVERYNNGEGDPDFNEAGAFLHSIYFTQFKEPSSSNQPEGDIKEFIETHFKSIDKFKDEVEKTAMGIQGSGWVYLAKNGSIKTIKNHQMKSDIVLLIDWWEHAWALDYQADKAGYLKNIYRIIDWSVINTRLV